MVGKTVKFEGADIAVVGLGASGQGAIEVLTALGSKVSGYDVSEAAVGHAQAVFPHVNMRVCVDEFDLAQRAQSHSLVVVSPGVPEISELFKIVPAHRLWGEVELAWQVQLAGSRPDIPWLTITGTNGKTTTVGMLEAILNAGGEKAAAVGNVGTPVVLAAADASCDVLAVELSSFQLRTTYSVAPQASLCLNIAADHLDWHGSFEAYYKAKARVYERTKVACIYSEADPLTRQMVENADVQEGCRAIGVTLGHPAPSDFGLVEDLLVDRAFLSDRKNQAFELASFSDLAHIAGPVPAASIVQDALAASALARAHGVPVEAIAKGLREFNPAGHRRAFVRHAIDVDWIDDSKATNAHAAQASLQACPPGRAVWIAGGLAKGQSFDDLVRNVRDRLRGVVVIGVDREPILSALRAQAPEVPYVELVPHDELMTSAVHEAVALSRPGDTVVLAPACASWDQFSSYSERGEAFTQAVMSLEEA